MGVQVHVVFTPKYRKKLLFGQIRRHLGTVFHELAKRKKCKLEEGHLMPDHVHMLISIPPKYSVAEVIGYLKGKSSIWIAQNVDACRRILHNRLWRFPVSRPIVPATRAAAKPPDLLGVIGLRSGTLI
jgi:putative transposase